MNDNDTIKARREARRRRILENSGTRLQKITGNSTEEEVINIKQNKTEKPTFIELCKDVHNASLIFDESNTPFKLASKLESLTEALDSSGIKEFLTVLSSQAVDKKEANNNNDDDKSQQTTNEQNNKTLFHTIYKLKLHLIFLAIIIRLLYYLRYNSMFYNSLFIPLAIFEISDFFIFPRNNEITNANSYINFALLFCGISQGKRNMFLRILYYWSKLWTDMCFYFFTFLLSNQIVLYLFENDGYKI